MSMTLAQFREIDSLGRQDDPKLFLLSTPDRPATEAELDMVEGTLKARLPPAYKAFLKEFGGGSFGLAIIFSADPDSEYYLPKKQSEVAWYLPSDMLAFSDDFAGGNYVLKVHGGQALESVFYWNQDGGLVSTPFENVLEFVARWGYSREGD